LVDTELLDLDKYVFKKMKELQFLIKATSRLHKIKRLSGSKQQEITFVRERDLKVPE
jgi:hypothetical protein